MTFAVAITISLWRRTSAPLWGSSGAIGLRGLTWHRAPPRYYQYAGLPFSCRTAPYAFTQFMLVLVRYLRRLGINVLGYIDDFAVVCRSRAAGVRLDRFLRHTFASLGLVLNFQKKVLGSTCSGGLRPRHRCGPGVSYACHPGQAEAIGRRHGYGPAPLSDAWALCVGPGRRVPHWQSHVVPHRAGQNGPPFYTLALCGDHGRDRVAPGRREQLPAPEGVVAHPVFLDCGSTEGGCFLADAHPGRKTPLHVRFRRRIAMPLLGSFALPPRHSRNPSFGGGGLHPARASAVAVPFVPLARAPPANLVCGLGLI